MRFWIEGDDQRGPGNVGVVIPPGVAHALRADPSRDALMVYGTSTVFDPEAEGRIADEIERPEAPEEWAAFFQN
jgi:quercetin dioxygenase-like cupin family protein